MRPRLHLRQLERHVRVGARRNDWSRRGCGPMTTHRGSRTRLGVGRAVAAQGGARRVICANAAPPLRRRDRHRARQYRRPMLRPTRCHAAPRRSKRLIDQPLLALTNGSSRRWSSASQLSRKAWLAKFRTKRTPAPSRGLVSVPSAGSARWSGTWRCSSAAESGRHS
jgi:hypothetical protein